MIIAITNHPEVFAPNEDLSEDDIRLFDEMLGRDLSSKEREFFENMKAKEEGEFAPSADLVLDEHNNSDELFLVRYYYSEYRIGRGLPSNRQKVAIYRDSLCETFKADLFPRIGQNITFWELLKANEVSGINYN